MAPESRARGGRPASAEPAVDQGAIDALLANAVEDLGRSSPVTEDAPGAQPDGTVVTPLPTAISGLFAHTTAGAPGASAVDPVAPLPPDLGLDQATIDALFANAATPGEERPVDANQPAASPHPAARREPPLEIHQSEIDAILGPLAASQRAVPARDAAWLAESEAFPIAVEEEADPPPGAVADGLIAQVAEAVPDPAPLDAPVGAQVVAILGGATRPDAHGGIPVKADDVSAPLSDAVAGPSRSAATVAPEASPAASNAPVPPTTAPGPPAQSAVAPAPVVPATPAHTRAPSVAPAAPGRATVPPAAQP
ncbi:MAG: hypothetical protein FJ029_06990, partial [Actinobacteria bacterium]|nr:hypothetical protein [Actinomycetota bacterium]